jgi:hypothetical protein
MCIKLAYSNAVVYLSCCIIISQLARPIANVVGSTGTARTVFRAQRNIFPFVFSTMISIAACAGRPKNFKHSPAFEPAPCARSFSFRHSPGFFRQLCCRHLTCTYIFHGCGPVALSIISWSSSLAAVSRSHMRAMQQSGGAWGALCCLLLFYRQQVA